VSVPTSHPITFYDSEEIRLWVLDTSLGLLSFFFWVGDESALIRYLNVPNIMAAAISHRCTMLHPGYGFLAENATFVDICKDHGLNFIGPNVSRFAAFLSGFSPLV
jgi:hypothetical protein